MAKIAWTEEAVRWLEDIYSYIAVESPAAASRTIEGITIERRISWNIPRSAFVIHRRIVMSGSSCTDTTVSRT